MVNKYLFIDVVPNSLGTKFIDELYLLLFLEMIKTINRYMMIALIMLLSCQDISAQKTNYRTEIDTLKTFDKRVLVKCRIFMNENLIEECIAYLYPVIYKIPRFKPTGNLIQKEIEMDSIVRHGTTKKYFENKLIQVAEFADGKEISAIYYDQNGTEISKQEYMNIYNLRDPCGTITGEYFIRGQKKKKK